MTRHSRRAEKLGDLGGLCVPASAYVQRQAYFYKPYFEIFLKKLQAVAPEAAAHRSPCAQTGRVSVCALLAADNINPPLSRASAMRDAPWVWARLYFSKP
jgi:hypothetical protein